MNRFRVRLAVLAVLFLSGPVAARAEVADCTAITTVPATISASGVYCLKGNLSFAGPGSAITVTGGSGVVLDLNGHVLTGTTGTTAIEVQGGRILTVRNGTIRSFSRAALLEPSSFNATFEDLHIAVLGDQSAIEAEAWGTVVQRNWIERGNPAVRTIGGSSRVSDNDIVNAMSGIDMVGSNGFVEDNRVKSLSNGAGYGIRSDGSRSFLSRNSVSSFSTCFDMSATTRYRENVTVSCTFAYSGGSSAGSNY
jgi:hypothetical protein